MDIRSSDEANLGSPSEPGRATSGLNNLESQELQLSWQPEERDWAEAFAARNRERKAWYKIWGLGGVALLIAVVLFAASTDHRPAIVWLGIAVGFPLLRLLLQPLSVRTFWRRNPALQEPLQALVSSTTGITLSGRSTGHYPWPIVHSFLETERVFVIQVTGYRKLAFFLLAKRGLPPDRTVDQLHAALSRGTARSTLPAIG